MTGVIHLFAGQGDFAVSPLARLTRPGGPLRPAAQEVFEQVDRVAVERGATPLAAWLFSARAPSGRDLSHAAVGTTQLALFGASMTVHRALCASFPEPEALLGVSFGEIAALTAAGVYSVADGARIAHDLGRILTACPGGMTVLTCPRPTAALLTGRPETRNLVVACVNDDHETVVSGPVRELAALEESAADKGVAAVRLRLPFSSHHPGLADQAEAFAAAARAYPAREPRIPVYSAVAGRAYTATDDLPRMLADCLIRPAVLPDVLRRAAAGHPHAFYEAGTGSALSRSTLRVLADSPVTVHAPLVETGFRWPAH